MLTNGGVIAFSLSHWRSWRRVWPGTPLVALLAAAPAAVAFVTEPAWGVSSTRSPLSLSVALVVSIVEGPGAASRRCAVRGGSHQGSAHRHRDREYLRNTRGTDSRLPGEPKQVGTIVVVWRSSPQEAHTDLPTDLIGDTDHIVRVGHVGVSEARNAGLDRLADLGLLDDDHVVSFPDDDCVYPSDLTTALDRRAHRSSVPGTVDPETVWDRRRFPSTSFAVRAVDVP